MIRDEAAGDAPAVRIVLEEAFGTPVEAGLVDALRAAWQRRGIGSALIAEGTNGCTRPGRRSCS